ncbi:MAG: hypothetical protein NTX59_11680 [Elusimicrobia bacterium]|nr:hypothetical protein [Elusimicrobiota bacterium]
MKHKKKGQLLVEVAVATVIAATTAMGTFSVILSSFASQKKADKREACGFILKQAQETLKSYVSAEPANSNYTPGSGLVSPGSPNGGRWAADSSGAWALAAGLHDISSLLPNPPFLPGASLTYTVQDNDCMNLGTGFNACKIVRFTLTYQD